MNESFVMPAATADRIDGYMRQIEQLQLAVQETVRTAGEVLAVPDGWRYDPQRRTFVVAEAEPAPPEEE